MPRASSRFRAPCSSYPRFPCIAVSKNLCIAVLAGALSPPPALVYLTSVTLGLFAVLVAAGSFLAGMLGALTGLGGGIIVVPMLILLARFQERSAMATSLAAIGLIAVVGTVSYALRGDVHWGYGLLLGLPAAVGAFAGTTLQQRLGGRLLSYGFAALLAAIAIWLLV